MYIYFLNFKKSFKILEILEILEEYSFPTFQWSERDSWVAGEISGTALQMEVSEGLSLRWMSS